MSRIASSTCPGISQLCTSKHTMHKKLYRLTESPTHFFSNRDITILISYGCTSTAKSSMLSCDYGALKIREDLPYVFYVETPAAAAA